MTKSLLGKRLLSFVATFLLAVTAFAQITVKGVVKDETGEPIIGANVLVKGTTNGTITDFDGNYAIEGVGRNATLVFSYVGYNNLEIAVNGQNTINATLKEDSQALDEVMVVGYATGSKRTVSGAVDRVKKEDMNKGAVLGAADALKGKVAGVSITSAGGGDPMAASNIAIRGVSSLAGGNDPLVIVDGVFGDMRMLQALSSNDIETMTILKDASETAQYGSRGAAGVIVVTTTKGKAGVAKIDYSGQFGIGSTYKKLEMLSPEDYVKQPGGIDEGFRTNWYDEVTRSTTITQNHNIAFTTGNENGNMRASVGVIQNQGLLKKNSDMMNYTAKMDATQFAFNKKLKFEMGLMGSLRQGKSVYNPTRTWNSVFACIPTYSAEPVDGIYRQNDAGVNAYNPAGILTIDNTMDVNVLNAHAKATWTILEGLNLSAFGSYTTIGMQTKTYIPNNIYQGLGDNGRADIRNTNRSDMMGNVQLSYTKDLGKHHIDALALMEGQVYNTGYNRAQSKGFETNYFGYNNMQAGSTVNWGDVQSNKSQYKLMSYMARLNYMFADRYIATVNVRTDGSSKLGANHKWGWFPSASVAWIISNESWLKGNPNVNNLKLRAGYGVTGNQDAISAYNSLQLMNPSGTTIYNSTQTTTYSITQNSNPDLQWETKKTFDVGVDGQFFGGRLNVTLDYYMSTTSNMLYNYSVPVPPFTYGTLLANIGEMTNNGFEFAIGGDIVKTKDFTFTANFNAAFQKNKLKSLHGTYKGQELSTAEHIEIAGVYGSSGLSDGRGTTYLIEGQPVGTFFIPKFKGFDETGNYILEDLNGDGKIDTSTEGGDRYIAGQALPKMTAGLNLAFKYKNWDLTAQFNGAFGHKIYNGTSETYMNMNMINAYNVLAAAPTGGNGKGIYGIINSDYWLEKGDYVNLEYITLGYNFNMKNVKAIQNLRLALSCNNVATFTGYSGLTPLINSTSISGLESIGEGTVGNMGVDDKRVYPLQRTFSLQLNVTF
ncbi:MAG: TonB-dependent receptor [Bacteroidaceae bacterium]|nr:TonB-dependent receptor [Bacteroidaceae bacterium]